MVTKSIHRLVARPDGDVPPGEATRFSRHLFALISTKIADGLIDPKLVLAWILTAIGAPGYLVGALVPAREAGALLPQVVLAREIQKRSIRKYFWAAGSLVQGIAAIGIAVAALTLTGAPAGWTILGCLAVLATARAACSASHKDVLARTVAKGSRGKLSGAAGTVAALIVFAYALLLSADIIPREPSVVAIGIAVAGGLWIVAALVFMQLDEPADNDADGTSDGLRELLAPLRQDAEFQNYVIVRGLLIATALAPPFLVMLINQSEGFGLGNLGLLLIASSAAAISSSYVWGLASDRSSRRTLALSAIAAATIYGIAAAVGMTTGGIASAWVAAALIFVAQIAYEGARAGRKTHLTDMDTGGAKAVYTALSNAMIGVLLLLGRGVRCIGRPCRAGCRAGGLRGAQRGGSGLGAVPERGSGHLTGAACEHAAWTSRDRRGGRLSRRGSDLPLPDARGRLRREPGTGHAVGVRRTDAPGATERPAPLAPQCVRWLGSCRPGPLPRAASHSPID